MTTAPAPAATAPRKAARSDAGLGPIAFYLPSLRGGGAERVTVNLAQGISERGFAVDVVVASAEGELLEQLPATVRLINLQVTRVLPSLPPLVAYLRRERPRILISAMGHANLVALWAAKLALRRTPVMVTVHTTVSQFANLKGWLARQLWPSLMRFFYPWADSVVAVSSGSADDLTRLSRMPRRRVNVVYNPVITPAALASAGQPPDHPWFAPGEPPVIIGVGRLTPSKDFPRLMRAFRELRRQRAARLMILGEGEERAKLESLAVELGLEEDVAFPGFRSNVMSYLAGSAMFVLSSTYEGLPTALIEALAAGTRIVSTDCPNGPREILEGGKLGTLVPVGDTHALARAMLAALDQPKPTVPPEALAPYTQEVAIDEYLRLIERAS